MPIEPTASTRRRRRRPERIGAGRIGAVRVGAVRVGAALLASVLAGVLLAACGGDGTDGGSPGGPTSPGPTSPSNVPRRTDADLVIWTDADRADAVRGLADVFADSRDVTAAVQAVPGDLQAAFLAGHSAGGGPDVVVGSHEWIGSLGQNGAIDPVGLTEADQQRYAPLALDAVTYKSEIYGLPYAMEALALFRDTDVAPTAPGTIEELAQQAEEAGAERALCVPIGPQGDAYHLHPLYTSAGGYVFSVGADGEYDVSDLGVGKAGSIAAATKLSELGARGVLATDLAAEDVVPSFVEGRCPFLVAGPWAVDEVRAGKSSWAVSPVVGYAGMQPAVPFTGVQAFFVASKGQGRDLAHQFVLDSVNSPEAMHALYAAEPRPPVMLDVLAAVTAADPTTKVFADAAATGQLLPAVPQVSAVWGPLGAAEAAIIDGADPTSTMADAAARIAEGLR